MFDASGWLVAGLARPEYAARATLMGSSVCWTPEAGSYAR
jgi:hypothetical protein